MLVLFHSGRYMHLYLKSGLYFWCSSSGQLVPYGADCFSLQIVFLWTSGRSPPWPAIWAKPMVLRTKLHRYICWVCSYVFFVFRIRGLGGHGGSLRGKVTIVLLQKAPVREVLHQKISRQSFSLAFRHNIIQYFCWFSHCKVFSYLQDLDSGISLIHEDLSA